LRLPWCTITETNRIHLVLLGMQNRIWGPCSAAIDMILVSVVHLCVHFELLRIQVSFGFFFFFPPGGGGVAHLLGSKRGSALAGPGQPQLKSFAMAFGSVFCLLFPASAMAFALQIGRALLFCRVPEWADVEPGEEKPSAQRLGWVSQHPCPGKVSHLLRGSYGWMPASQIGPSVSYWFQ
jgi:hypothetical protein